MEKVKVLFVCVHNSARSQIAEAFLKELANDQFEVESAGLEPGNLNPFVVEVMKEVGIDISNNQTKSVFDFYAKERKFDFVISVCDAAAAERCPIFPGQTNRLNWSFEDPSAFNGSQEEKLARTRLVRDKIKSKIDNLIQIIN